MKKLKILLIIILFNFLFNVTLNKSPVKAEELYKQTVTVTWNYPYPKVDLNRFELRLNKGNKLITILKNNRLWKGELLVLNGSNFVELRAVDNSEQVSDWSNKAFFTYTANSTIIPKTNWSLHYVDSEELNGENGAAINAFDDNVSTIWHTEWYTSNPPHPHEIQINLGKTYTINKLKYLPRQDGCSHGTIAQYELYTSINGSDWGTPIAVGTFENNTLEKEITFSPTTCQFIKLRALNEINDNPWTSIAEIDVLGETTQTPTPPSNFIIIKNY